MAQDNLLPPYLEANFPDIAGFVQRVRAFSAHHSFFVPDRPIYIARAPGRLDLMGGNDDYTGGLVFEATIREATRVAVQRRSDNRVLIANPQVQTMGWHALVEYEMDDLWHAGQVYPVEHIHQLLRARPGHEWTAYVLGDLYFLMKQFPERITSGISIFLESDVPIGKGVSSSAALEVAVMKAIAAAYSTHAQGVPLALWCQWVENAIAQSASGVMDQITVVMGDRDHLLPLVCQPCQPEPLVRLPAPLRYWAIDSGVRHAVSGIEYEAARAATFMGYRIICEMENLPLTLDESGVLARWVDPRWKGYLANLSPSEYRARFEKHLPEMMTGADFSARYPIHADPYTAVRPEVVYPIRACTRYAVEENHRVRLFVELVSHRQESLTERTMELLGELMYQSHYAYTECGLGSAATDLIVDLVKAEGTSQGLYGAKVTGGGAGGTVAILGVQSERANKAFQRVVSRFEKETGYTPYIFEGSSPGADHFGILEIYLS